MIILVGLMGAGKSILGKQLASHVFLNLKLIDLDELIVEHAGKSIPDIFEIDGEKAFRALESKVLVEMIDSKENLIIATGGGAVLSEHNRDLMRSYGKVIWLDATPEVLTSRVQGDVNRPLLKNVDVLKRMVELAEQRNPLYAEVADLRIDTGKLSDKEAVAQIIGFLSDYDA